MSGPTFPQPTSGWHVVSQTPGSQVGADGRVVDGMVVGYVTGQGVSSSVFVPWTAYNKDNVAAAINAQAGHTDVVASLTDKG